MTEFHSGPSTQLETDEEQLAPSLHLLPGGGHVAYRYRPGRCRAFGDFVVSLCAVCLDA